MAEVITVKLREKAVGVKTVFRDPQEARFLEGVMVILNKEGTERYSFPIHNILAVKAEEK